jgi:hypothetical protein
VQTKITFTASDGTALPGLLTMPDGATGAGPALVMLYEAFGMTDEMRRVAHDLATDGYTVLIPDLFARSPAKPICVGPYSSHHPARGGPRARRPGVGRPEAGHSFFTRTSGMPGAIAARAPLHAEYHAPSTRTGGSSRSSGSTSADRGRAGQDGRYE